jgi:hypothetical protein
MPMPDIMHGILLKRNPDFGGITGLITGSVGCGKTSLIADIAEHVLKSGNQEYVYWRDFEACQFCKFLDHNPPIPVKIFLPENKEIIFHARNNEFPEGFPTEIFKFRDFGELISKAELGLVNVLYLDDIQLIDFIEYLQRTCFDWTSIYIDECESLAQFGSSGKRYKAAEKFAKVVNNARKYRMSVYCDTQNASDIYHFAVSKFKVFGLGEGARTISQSPVWKTAIQSLKKGEAWISSGGLYQKIKIYPYISKHDVRAEIHDIEKPTEV